MKATTKRMDYTTPTVESIQVQMESVICVSLAALRQFDNLEQFEENDYTLTF